MLNVPERRFRPELHGVRGLALLGVVLFHLFGQGRISGGIDIFLAVTGFLFVGMLLRELDSTGRINLTKYFGRLFRRIFVPAALVIGVTAVAAYFIVPKTDHRQIFAEARASLLYVENFELIRSQLAYGAAGPQTSLYQHFWSLSVQGQFYVGLPIFFALVAIIAGTARRMRFDKAIALALTGILVASLLWAIVQGHYAQDEAYLSMWTRQWEFAFGGLVALVLDHIHLRNSWRLAAGWIGLVMIATTGFVFDGGQVFPGPLAFWPLVGWLLVMVAGDLSGTPVEKLSSSRFLTSAPVRWFADRSYGIYLWHWSVLIFYLNIKDQPAVGIRGAAVVFVIAVGLAGLTYRVVEQRLAPKSTSRIGSVLKRNKTMISAGAAAMLVGALVITPLTQPNSTVEAHATYDDLDSDTYPGADIAFWDDNRELPEADVYPAPEDAGEFTAPYFQQGCEQRWGDDPGTDVVLVCEDEDAPAQPTATIVLAGGSFAGHWETTFKSLAKKHGWEVLVLDKGGCPLGGEPSPDSMCGKYNENLVDWLDDNDVDLVVTSGSRTDEQEVEEYILDRAPDWWDKITGTGAKLMLMRAAPKDDNLNIPRCISGGGTSQDCGIEKKWLDEDPQTDLPEGAYSLDMKEYICPAINDPSAKNCDAVVGNILTSYDNGHFTVPFAQSLANGLEKEMQKDFDWLLKPADDPIFGSGQTVAQTR